MSPVPSTTVAKAKANSPPAGLARILDPASLSKVLLYGLLLVVLIA